MCFEDFSCVGDYDGDHFKMLVTKKLRTFPHFGDFLSVRRNISNRSPAVSNIRVQHRHQHRHQHLSHLNSKTQIVSLISDFISYKHLHIDCKILCFRGKQLYYNIFTWDKRHEVSSAYEIVRILGTHFWNFV